MYIASSIGLNITYIIDKIIVKIDFHIVYTIVMHDAPSKFLNRIEIY